MQNKPIGIALFQGKVQNYILTFSFSLNHTNMTYLNIDLKYMQIFSHFQKKSLKYPEQFNRNEEIDFSEII